MLSAAIIGSREPSYAQRKVAELYTSTLIQLGFKIRTGGAVGIDEIAMRVTSQMGGELEVVLPWASYNSDLITKYKPQSMLVFDPKIHQLWEQTVHEFHPNPKALAPAAIKLHARNFPIVGLSDITVALPGATGGGTMQGIRIARGYKLPLITFQHVLPLSAIELNVPSFVTMVRYVMGNAA